MIQAADGNFYGTTYNGGVVNAYSSGYGTIFEVTPRGTLTTLYEFCSEGACADGGNPAAGLIQASDGNFYGTTPFYGTPSFTDGGGTVFKITPTGVLTTLYSFCSQGACADGEVPAALIQGTDGNFYGPTGGPTPAGRSSK